MQNMKSIDDKNQLIYHRPLAGELKFKATFAGEITMAVG